MPEPPPWAWELRGPDDPHYNRHDFVGCDGDRCSRRLPLGKPLLYYTRPSPRGSAYRQEMGPFCGYCGEVPPEYHELTSGYAEYKHEEDPGDTSPKPGYINPLEG